MGADRVTKSHIFIPSSYQNPPSSYFGLECVFPFLSKYIPGQGIWPSLPHSRAEITVATARRHNPIAMSSLWQTPDDTGISV